MDMVSLTIHTTPGGEAVLENFDVPLPLKLGREEDTSFLSIKTGDGGSYALQTDCDGVSRAHCTIERLESGHFVLRDTSSNGVFLLEPGKAPQPVDKMKGLTLQGGDTRLEIPGLRVTLAVSASDLPDGPAPMLEPIVEVAPEPAPAPTPEPAPEVAAEPQPAPEPAAPELRHVHIDREAPLVMVDETDTQTELHSDAVVFSVGPQGLGIKVYPMARIEDLLQQPVSAGRNLIGAIGATDDGILCIAAAADGEVKVNRGPVGSVAAPRLLSALDTIEIGGRLLRITEQDQRYLVCGHCKMSNPYAPSDNCSHCGNRLINAVTRFVS